MLQQRDPCGDESTDNKERSTDPRSPYLWGVHFDILTESVINSVLWSRKRRYRGFDLFCLTRLVRRQGVLALGASSEPRGSGARHPHLWLDEPTRATRRI